MHSSSGKRTAGNTGFCIGKVAWNRYTASANGSGWWNSSEVADPGNQRTLPGNQSNSQPLIKSHRVVYVLEDHGNNCFDCIGTFAEAWSRSSVGRFVSGWWDNTYTFEYDSTSVVTESGGLDNVFDRHNRNPNSMRIDSVASG
jgi:hypothetical protein